MPVGQIKDKMNKLLDEAVENTFGSNRDLVDLRLEQTKTAG